MKNLLNSREDALDRAIGWILITGVILSLVLEVTGVIMYYFVTHNMSLSRDPSVYIRGHDFFSFIWAQIVNQHSPNAGLAWITAGISILILTPYIRVIASVAFFAWENNRKFVVITLFVLAIVTLSLALH
jgi:uncharacterized membrane protein